MKTKTNILKTKTINRESPITRRIKELLSEIVSVRSIDFWKSLGESHSLVRARRDPSVGAEAADILYLSKDRTHAVLMDCHVPDVLTDKQSFVFLGQIAHLLKNRDFPLRTISVIFLLPEGSKQTSKLLATFSDSFKIPTSGLRKTSLSSALVKERGVRVAKNAHKYQVSLTYKDHKFDFALTVKVVEGPKELFEMPKVQLERTRASLSLGQPPPLPPKPPIKA